MQGAVAEGDEYRETTKVAIGKNRPANYSIR
jgi:hypothetical protein